MKDDIIYVVDKYGAIMGRRPFRGSIIAKMCLQFSSNRGTAFCVSAERVPKAVIYYERE